MKRCLLCLQELPIFQGLDKSEFANVCFSATKRRITKESFLFFQGEPANTVYLIKAGKFKLVQVTDQGREIILDVIGPGEVLGETALFQQQDQEHLFSAVAMEETMVCCFSRQQFEKLLQQDPGFAVKIISYLGQKLYDTTQQLSEAIGTPVKEKLLRLLIKLADEYGRKIPNGTIIDLEITQQELANMIGASRVMVAQILKELRKMDIVDRRGKCYILKTDPCIEKYFS
ncbi:MAG: family transcriptional regulator, cyclic receptor protein [Clostridia bacterium]|nr:family transcriptional regulator, cyclic receptor protein [Clostridia bacterium]